jgi:tetratricopeptide (TPR) repeat protein
MRLVIAAALALSTVSAAAAWAQEGPTANALKEAREHYGKGEAFMAEESFAKAAAEFRMATRLDPEYTLAYYSLGQANMALKRYQEAATAYEACQETILDLAKMNVQERGEARQARTDELLDIEAAIMRWGGPDAPPNTQLMRLQERKRLIEQQQEKDSISAPGVPAELSVALGSAYFRLDRLADAEREYVAAIDAGEPTGAAHNNVAVVYMMTERFDQARESVRLAEEAGFRVNPLFKEDLEERAAAAQ